MRLRPAVPPLCAAAITLLVAASATPPSLRAAGPPRTGPSETSGPRGGDWGGGGNVGGGSGSGGGGGNTGSGGGNSGGGSGNSGGSGDSGSGGNGSGHHNGGNGHHDGGRHDGGRRGHGGGYHGYHYPRFWGSVFFGWPYPYWYYGPWGYYDDGDYEDGYSHDRTEQGALDLDLSPADTQVYVNGQYVGKVDDFDGWPQYLWLDTGTYDIVFYREGYKTLARQVTIYRGLVIDWDDRLERGPSIRPEDLETKTHERRDARVEQDREMRERHESRDNDGEDSGDERREIRKEIRREIRRDDPGRDGRDDDSGHLRLTIEPHDASVYLDGRFLGTGDDVGRMSSGLPVAPGSHTLSVVRPGRHAEEQRFEVRPGAQIELRIELKSE